MQETLAHANPALTNAHGTLEGEKQHIELPAKRCLVGGLNPLKNMSSSAGIMTFPIYGKS